jgi:hypothetical protein
MIFIFAGGDDDTVQLPLPLPLPLRNPSVCLLFSVSYGSYADRWIMSPSMLWIVCRNGDGIVGKTSDPLIIIRSVN